MSSLGDHAHLAVKTIWAATDFSATAQRAVEYAAALSRHFSSRLELLNILDPSLVTDAVEGLQSNALDVLREQGKQALIEQSNRLADLPVRARMVENFAPADAILREADLADADLIVLGTTAKKGLVKLALGSIAEEVLRKASCPVWTVGPKCTPLKQKTIALKSIVYATDFSPRAARAALYAFMMAQSFGAKLYLCHVLPEADSITGAHQEKEAFLAELKRMIPPSAYAWCEPECIVEHGRPAHVLLHLAQHLHADLIVLGARQSSFWLTYVETGLTSNLLADVHCPVLTVC